MKKETAVFLCTILVASSVIFSLSFDLSSANPGPAPPINHIYINANGSIDPPTAPIQRNGNTYTFTDNMPNSTLTVLCDNITIDGAGYGIHGYSTHYHTGITISSRQNMTIKNANIGPFGYGVEMDNGYNNTVTANIISAFASVLLENSDNNRILGNSLADGYGVMGGGSNNQIIGNNFTSGLSGGGNGMGIYVWGNYNTISDNFMQEELSIQLPQSMYNVISNNTIVNGNTGILLPRSSHNMIFGNLLANKTDPETGAVYISSGSYDNTVYNNRFENNSMAISLGAQVVDHIWKDVADNRIYLNNFINNTQTAWIAPGAPVNYWDNGTHGNYWSDFVGDDWNSDGISEIPNIFTANNTDYHPLMLPVNYSNIPIPYATQNAVSSPTSTMHGSQSDTEPTSTIPELPSRIALTAVTITLAFTLLYLLAKKRKQAPQKNL